MNYKEIFNLTIESKMMKLNYASNLGKRNNDIRIPNSISNFGKTESNFDIKSAFKKGFFFGSPSPKVKVDQINCYSKAYLELLDVKANRPVVFEVEQIFLLLAKNPYYEMAKLVYDNGFVKKSGEYLNAMPEFKHGIHKALYVDNRKLTNDNDLMKIAIEIYMRYLESCGTTLLFSKAMDERTPEGWSLAGFIVCALADFLAPKYFRVEEVR